MRTTHLLASLILLTATAFATAAPPTTQSNSIDQATIDRAMQKLKERQASRDAGQSGVGNDSPPCPADVDESTWRELKIYLGREQTAVAWDIRNTLKYTTDQKSYLRAMKMVKTPTADDLQSIRQCELEIATNEQRIADLRAGKAVSGFHGPNLDLEHPRLNQIGYIGTGGKGDCKLVYRGDGRSSGDESLVNLEWGRWADRTRQMDSVSTKRYRLHIDGKPTNVTAETHDVDAGGASVTDSVKVATVAVTLRDPEFFTGVNAVKWEYGAPVENSNAYQVTKVGPGSVELTLVNIAKLKDQWRSAK